MVSAYLQVDSSVMELIIALGSEQTNLTSIKGKKIVFQRIRKGNEKENQKS